MAIENKAVVVMSRNQALYLLKTIWPDAPVNEQIKAAMICQQYQLNPLMRQLYLIKFGKDWVTVLGIKASRQIAQQHHKYSYADGPRVMSEEEQRKILGETETGRIWAITVLKDSDGNTYPGYGFWPKDINPYGGDKGNSARNMAFIRSERNALDKMAPGELPDIEATDETYAPIGNIKVALEEGKKEFIAQGEQDKVDLYGEPAPSSVKPSQASPSEQGGQVKEQQVESAKPIKTDAPIDVGIDMDWLMVAMKKIHWSEFSAKTWLKVKSAESLATVLAGLSQEQKKLFCDHIKSLEEVA